MERPHLKSLAWLLGGLCIAMAVSGLVFSRLNGLRLSEMVDEMVPLVSELTISYAAVGAFIAWHRPRHVIGWLFLGAAFFQGLNNFTEPYARYTLITYPGALPFGPEASWLSQLSWAPGLLSLL